MFYQTLLSQALEEMKEKYETAEIELLEVIIQTRNYHMSGMCCTIKYCIRAPRHVFSMMIAGLILDKYG